MSKGEKKNKKAAKAKKQDETKVKPKAKAGKKSAAEKEPHGAKAAVAARTEAFRKLENELWLSDYLMRVTEFDGETVAPANGATARADAMEALSAQHHALLTSKTSVKLVRSLEDDIKTGRVSEAQLHDEVRVLARDQREALAIPTDEAAAWTRLTCEANAVWHKAKLANDWESFEPYVKQILETLKRHAGYLNSQADPYDVWLDQYERGLTSAVFDAFAAQVKETVVPLVREIQEKGKQTRALFRTKRVPLEVQKAISYDLMELVGLSLDDAALAFTEHPFSVNFAGGDGRIATHIYENDCLSNVYSVIHEAGHTIYDLNVNPAYQRTCLAEGTSMGIHESQSRFFENTVGRSRAFMKPLLEILRKHVPEVYGKIGELALYRAVNIAQPSLIRTEADELTYPLHIMIRYELERMLFAGEAKVKDIPALWNQLTKEYLGIDTPDDAHGCLQDTHWSGGSFGYFPTYALGSAYDAQYALAMERDDVDLESCCKTGDLEPVRAWLGSRIWRFGRSKDAVELIRDSTGMPFDAKYYCEYLDKKFRALYKL